MTVNIVSGFENVYKVIKGCIDAEMVPDGLLEDVESFIPIYNEEEKRFLEPAGQDELYQLLEPQLL